MSENAGEFQSFLTITENRSQILAVIVAMVHDFDLAEELFQETVVEILKSEQQFDPRRRFVPWACGVARNVVFRHWRRNSQDSTCAVSEMIAELALDSVEVDDEVWRRERKALRHCLQQLPDRAQQLLMLRYGRNIKGKQLASQSAYRPGSIRTTLLRLRQQLRDCIETKTGPAMEASDGHG